MVLFHETLGLLRKEFLLEWRNRYAFLGLLLYVACTVFVSYLAFRQIIEPATWNAVFWIIILFAAVNAGAKGFLQESRGLQLYYHTLASPQAVILSRIVFNTVLLWMLSLICLALFSVMMGHVITDNTVFVLTLLLGGAGLAAVLSLTSAIASKTGQNVALTAILSFPVLMPLLITLIKASAVAMEGGATPEDSSGFLYALLLLDVITVTMSLLLFPYLWKE